MFYLILYAQNTLTCNQYKNYLWDFFFIPFNLNSEASFH